MQDAAPCHRRPRQEAIVAPSLYGEDLLVREVQEKAVHVPAVCPVRPQAATIVTTNPKAVLASISNKRLSASAERDLEEFVIELFQCVSNIYFEVYCAAHF